MNAPSTNKLIVLHDSESYVANLIMIYEPTLHVQLHNMQ